MYKNIALTGFLFLGVLFFCFGQSPKQDFIKELKTSGKKTRKRTKEFLETLQELQVKYKDHLVSDCSDRIELERNFGAYYYLNYIDSLTFKYWLNAAENLIPQCSNLSDSLRTQIYLNLEGGYERLKTKKGDEERAKYISKIKIILKNENDLSLKFQAKTIERVADWYYDNNDSDNSLLWIRKALNIYKDIPVYRKTLLAYKRYADILYYNLDYNSSIEWYEKLYDATDQLYPNSKTNLYKFYALYGLSIQNIEKENYIESKKYADQILNIGNQEKDSIWLVDGYYLNGLIAARQKNYKLSSFHIQNAIAILENDKSSIRKKSLGRFYKEEFSNNDQLNNNSLAKKYLLKCDSLYLVNKKNDKILFDVSKEISLDKNEMLIVGIESSKFAQKMGFDNKDIIRFSLDLDLICYELLSSVDGENYKSQLLKLHHENCDQIISYLFKNNLAEKYDNLTAYFISSSKSVSLFESIAKRDQIPVELKDSYRELKKKEIDLISGITVAVDNEEHSMVDSLSNIYFELSYELEELNKKLKKYDVNVDFRSYKDNIIEKAKEKLSENEALVEFFYGLDYIYGYSVCNNQVNFHFDTIPEVLDTDFLQLLYRDDTESISLMDKNLEILSKYFRPFFPDNFERIEDVTIISDGRLLYLPFEILQFNDNDLIRDVNINYAFSYNLNQYEYNDIEPAKYDYLGLGMKYGDGLLSNIEESSQITRSFDGKLRLSPLPFAVEEIKSGHALYGGKMFLEEECTIDNLVKHADKAKVIHIANHSLLNDSNSNLSSIIFGNANMPDLYNVIDIKALELKADLAILSSCNSGIGKIFDGNGIRSLGQSFAQAGCPAVMVNLWEANDKSSRFIIDKFNQNIKEGLHKSEALRKAKIDYLDQATPSLRHPKYWANIILIGNNEPIQFGSNSNWIYYLGVFLLVGMIAFWLVRKKELKS